MYLYGPAIGEGNRMAISNSSSETSTVAVPRAVASALRQFLAEQRTGNIQLNIRAGQILGMHVNEIVPLNVPGEPAANSQASRRRTG